MKKNRSVSGETFSETLVSVLIIAVTFVFLIQAVVSAARVNEKLKQQDVSFRFDPAAATEEITVRIVQENSDIKSTIPAVEFHEPRGEDGKTYDYYVYETMPALP